MTPWIVIGCIILFFVFLFTVHAYITIAMTDDMALTIRILGIPIKILPKKPKTYKISNYTLKKIRKRDAKAAEKAVKKAESKKKKQAEKEKKKAEKKAELEKLSKAVKDAAEEMREETAWGRQAYACALIRMQLLQKSKEAFRANGWDALGWGFENGDCRKALIMRFQNGNGAMIDLLLIPKKDYASNTYRIETKVERYDSGLVDENLRLAQLTRLNTSLAQAGVPVSMACNHRTHGMNANEVRNHDRFRKPDNLVSHQ